MKRAVIIVLDSLGVGELPDAYKYTDEGSNTLGNIAKTVKNFFIPNLANIGLGNIDAITGIDFCDKPSGCFGKMAEKSPGKDTTTGHWELSGIILDRPFPVYPDGFPKEIINEFEESIKVSTLANYPASGTEIINRLGDEHVKTGYPIVYTSADSVFQIAAHEDVIPVERLYEMCSIARRMLQGKHGVGRVIARPFVGISGNYVRTKRRKDFSLDPVNKTILDYACEKGYHVMAVGKIEDIFNNRGITHSKHTSNNMDGVDRTIEFIKSQSEGIIFTNLVDFDMVYGHRNDALGYAKALEEFDARVPEILKELKEEDILIITADHGCDPTTKSTDHSREYVPLLVYGKNIKNNVNLKTRSSFSDVAATIAEYLQIESDICGKSFLKDILKL
ncbi:phosphopentomutase [Herbivorax sp. ANBcel31]|uniref:phosphopentomutase n=1 Tax=Herbivorax sp. ANBcel31 TaxID=3069754 RepID=UPI0027ADCBE7|nr:phosphopentomutase [Herbivorax sp. ANBcel31]MDQ2086198.1 phosphopentomutase [Herbivorax sp. ANBcel31]